MNQHIFHYPAIEADFEYVKTLDLTKLTQAEYEFIEANAVKVFNIPPYSKALNGITFGLLYPGSNTFVVKHGIVSVSNGYNGPKPDKREFNLRLKFNPTFSNENKYYHSVVVTKFDFTAFEELSVLIEKSVNLYAKLF